MAATDFTRAAAAFTRQSRRYDMDDLANPILPSWRSRVYRHVSGFLEPGSHILELNSGTGIDARHFASLGHRVLATDASAGMVAQLLEKISGAGKGDAVQCVQLAFEDLDQLEGNFDYVFSNFGGLNCLEDLNKVVRHLPRLLKPGSYVTWVIMPPYCPWEWSWILKGSGKAFRRLRAQGTLAQVEGEPFIAYYHSFRDIKKSLGPRFFIRACEGLGSVSPPPSAYSFLSTFPNLSGSLIRLDERVGGIFPFSRWADHIIVTAQFRG